jgi:hypothetical protein
MGSAVVLEEHRRLGADVLAPMFERALGMLGPDAAGAAERAGAFVAEGLDNAQAAALQSELASAGIGSRVVGRREVVAARDPDCVRTVRIADDALHVTLGHTGPVVHVEWDRVVLLSAGAVADPASAAPNDLVGEAMERKYAEERGRRRELDVKLADVFARTEDGLLHVRLRSRDLSYRLILGPDFKRDISRDFPEVLARIGERAGRAFVTPGYRAACLGQETAGVADDEWCFGDEDRFDEFNRWRLQMIVLGVDVDAGDTNTADRPMSFRPTTPSTSPAAAATATAAAAAMSGSAAAGGASSLVGAVAERAPSGPNPAALPSRGRELMEFGLRAERGFAIVGKALRGLVAAAFLALMTWSWLRPAGHAPYVLLGLSLGDFSAMIMVLVNPAFLETLRKYHPEGYVLDLVSFIFLSGFYWSGRSFAGDVDLGVDFFLIAGAAGGGFFARTLAAFARQVERDL